MWLLIRIFLVMTFALSFGCGSKNKKADPAVSETKRTSILTTDILNKIDSEEYKSALEMAEVYLRDYPVAPQTQNVEYLKARALEGLGRTEEAIEAYRKIVRVTATPKDLVAKSLYRLSFCYEATNQDDKLVASLLDVLKRKGDLETEVTTAEVPARIAAAYARIGNKKLADKYFGLADTGIRNLKTKNSGIDLTKWLPKTLYFMGTMSVGTFTTEDFENSLRPLEKSQGFLLEAALFGDPKWSPKAVEEIKSIYSGLVALIQKTGAEESENEEQGRVRQEVRWRMAAGTLEALRKLKSESFSPKEANSAEIEEIKSFLSSKEIELTKVLEERPVGHGLTPEAESRKKSLRKSRVVNPDPMLEEMSRGKNQ